MFLICSTTEQTLDLGVDVIRFRVYRTSSCRDRQQLISIVILGPLFRPLCFRVSV